MYTAYIGFYPRQTILKTWRSLGIHGRTVDGTFADALKVRDEFLLDNDGMCDLEVQIQIRKGKNYYPYFNDPATALKLLDANPIDRSRFSKANGGTKIYS
jgi:hypothetical protein